MESVRGRSRRGLALGGGGGFLSPVGRMQLKEGGTMVSAVGLLTLDYAHESEDSAFIMSSQGTQKLLGHRSQHE